MYPVSGGTLLRLTPGSSKPVWSLQERELKCTPSVFGNTVLVLGNPYGRAILYGVDRRTGKVESEVVCARSVGLDAGITASPHRLLARTSILKGTLVTSAFARGRLRLAGWTGTEFVVACDAAVYKNGILACLQDRSWVWLKEDPAPVLAAREWTPDLFSAVVPPTVLGDVVYFGGWAADAETGEILWRLPVELSRFGAVPADRMVIVVDAGGGLRAFRARVGG